MGDGILNNACPKRSHALLLILAVWLGAQAVTAGAAPIINEFMAANDRTLADEDGEFSDWIELHNPTAAAIPLGGWHLTDNPTSPVKWQFPAVTLAAGEYLVVFASGKNRAVAGAELHTNFQLDAGGEYLALVRPDGVSVEHAFAPTYPAQRADISCGSSDAVLLNEQPAVRYRVPADGALGAAWRDSAFNDSSWPAGALAVGFESGAGAELIGYWNFEGNLSDGSGYGHDGQNPGAVFSPDAPPALGAGQSLLIADVGGVVTIDNGPALSALTQDLTVAAWVKPNAVGVRQRVFGNNGSWVFGLNGTGLILTTRGVRDYTIAGSMQPNVWTHVAAVFHPGFDVTFYVNGLPVGTVAGTAPANPAGATWCFGSWDGGGAELFNGRLDDVAVWSGELTAPQLAALAAGGSPGAFNAGYRGLIDTDVEAAMHGRNATLYLRQTFTVANPTSFSALQLRLKYDDGFVAYLNGGKVAERNAPAVPAWNSASTAPHADAQARVFETIDISAFRGLLTAGANVLAIQALNAAAADDDFLLDAELVGGLDTLAIYYFDPPTPGAANSYGSLGWLPAPTFSHTRGYYGAAFQLQLSAPANGSYIMYTLDGSAPTATHGSTYSAPIPVNGTSVVRAAAFKSGYFPSPVETHTYLFLGDIATQSPNGETPNGWVAGPVNNQVFDYGMDPDITGHAVYGPLLPDALWRIPTLSIVTDLDHLLDPATGIYVNARQDGRGWERPTSLELIDPAGAPGFQTDAGLRIRGGFSRGAFNPKHSFRLFFRAEYGAAKLDYPLFEDEGVDEFDGIDLRTAQNYAWSNDTWNDATKNTFVREVWTRDTQRDMGRPYTRSRYYHLYLNGQYWGLYMTEERPEASFAESYFGGAKRDYDVVKPGGPTDGTLDAYNQFWQLANAGFATNAAYFQAMGKNPDGTDNLLYPVHLNLDNLVDYMLVVFFAASTDAPIGLSGTAANNYYAIRNRDATRREGWRYFSHDMEHSMMDVNIDRMGPYTAGDQMAQFNPQWLHQQLMQNAEYRLHFADRTQLHLHNGGVLSPARAVQRVQDRAAQIEQAIIGESARWGDQHEAIPYTKASWQAAIDYLVNTFMPQRGAVILQQFRGANLYPLLEPPAFSQHGGVIPAGFQLTINHPNASGVMLYALGGDDPRALGGGVSAAAVTSSGPVALSGSTTVKARVKDGATWSALTVAAFSQDITDVLRITELHYHPAPPPPGEAAAAGTTNRDDFEFVELQNTGAAAIDLTGVKFDDGIDFDFSVAADRILGPGEYVVVAKNQRAFEARYGAGRRVAGDYDQRLDNGGENVRLMDALGRVIHFFRYDDENGWPLQADGGGPSLEVIDTAGDYNDPANWRASAYGNGTPGRPNFSPGEATRAGFWHLY